MDSAEGLSGVLIMVKPYLSDTKGFQQILDSRLKGKHFHISDDKLSLVVNRPLGWTSKSWLIYEPNVENGESNGRSIDWHRQYIGPQPPSKH